MNENAILKSFLVKYKITEPVPADVRAAMNSSKRSNFKAIIGKETGGALFTGAVVSLFFWVKKFGMPISLAKSAIAVGAAVLVAASLLTYSAAVAVKHVLNRPGEIKQEAPVIPLTVEPVNIDEGQAEKVVVSYSVAVERVAAPGVSAAKRSAFNDTLLSELRRLKGERAAVSSAALDRYNVSSRVLSVSVIQIRDADGSGGIFRISAKVISSENSRVMLYVSETAGSEAEVVNTLKMLMGKVAAVL